MNNNTIYIIVFYPFKLSFNVKLHNYYLYNIIKMIIHYAHTHTHTH